MRTVTAEATERAPFGSVEYYANRLRQRVTTLRDLADLVHYMYAIGYIESAAENETLDADRLRERIRNILAAKELVADEVRAGARR